MKIPFIPSSAPFTAAQRAWLNGYLAGLFADANVGDASFEPGPAAPPNPVAPLLVLFGSQTGSAEQLARRIGTQSAQHGFGARVLELNAVAPADLTRETHLIIVTSTWGEGDPPDNATEFWKQLQAATAPRLELLHYAVLALGDRNYSDFCGAGRKFDERLAALGAKCLHPRADCDTDYDATARAWTEALWPALRSTLPPSAIFDSTGAPPAPPRYDRQRPFLARLVGNRRLNGPDSEKETRHFELALGSELSYQAGDALGVLPENCPMLVDEIIRALSCDGEEAVRAPGGTEVSLRSALLRQYAITQPSLTLLQALAERGDEELRDLLPPEHKPALERWLHGREVIDLLLRRPGTGLPLPDFIASLRKLQPRLYSISSSPKAHAGQVHLTVSVVRYEAHGRRRHGVCSTFLAERVPLGETPVPVFIQTSPNFRLPADPARPVIMIGPGTGIAPFRAFLGERRALGATGRNWLFFGDQRSSCDFLYREELLAWQQEGSLTRLDTAFSRDQAEKVYVQHRMLEYASELWAWLEEGAHVYVCGDAKRMAKDVDAALREIVRVTGGKNPDGVDSFMASLKSDQRYQRDVY